MIFYLTVAILLLAIAILVFPTFWEEAQKNVLRKKRLQKA